MRHRPTVCDPQGAWASSLPSHSEQDMASKGPPESYIPVTGAPRTRPTLPQQAVVLREVLPCRAALATAGYPRMLGWAPGRRTRRERVPSPSQGSHPCQSPPHPHPLESLSLQPTGGLSHPQSSPQGPAGTAAGSQPSAVQVPQAPPCPGQMPSCPEAKRHPPPAPGCTEISSLGMTN